MRKSANLPHGPSLWQAWSDGRATATQTFNDIVSRATARAAALEADRQPLAAADIRACIAALIETDAELRKARLLPPRDSLTPQLRIFGRPRQG